MEREEDRHKGTKARRHEGNAAMLLTPAGPAAIATIRIHGEGVEEFLRRHFSSKARGGHCVHGQLRDGEKVIDDPVVMLSEDGAWADLHAHGGPWVVQASLELLGREGFEIVTPGEEAPLWAVDGETILEREINAAMPLARTELAIRVLLAQKNARADFQSKIKNQKSKIRGILDDHSLHHLLHPPRVAIVGVPNVGKSTLANQLFAQERSITADLPGTTRDWVGELANIDGLAVMLVDTPGLRETPDAIEQKAIEQSRPVIEKAELVVLVLDCSAPLEGPQRQLVDRFPDALRVANKLDRACLWDAAALGAIATIATAGVGIDELRKTIRSRFGCENIDLNRPRVWTQRQREELLKLLS